MGFDLFHSIGVYSSLADAKGEAFPTGRVHAEHRVEGMDDEL